MIKLKWLGYDFSHLVLDAPYVTARAEPSIADTISIVKLANPNMIFSEGDPKSMLSDEVYIEKSWQGSPILIERDGETVLDGIVTDGVISRKDCTLEVQSRFSRSLKSYCNSSLRHIENQDKIDPATAILRLCKDAHIPDGVIDLQSFTRAAGELQNEGVYINAIADKQYQTPLLDAINALLEMGCMRAWLDTQLHVVMTPFRPQGAPVIALRILPQDILGDIQYGTTPRQTVEYSIGHIGDSFGAHPAEGELGIRYNGARPERTFNVEIWTQGYNANSQWQLVDENSAHAIGQIKLRQDRRKRTAKLTVRDNDAITLAIGGVYDIKPWPGYGWLTGYEKKQGVIDMYFEEALEYV